MNSRYPTHKHNISSQRTLNISVFHWRQQWPALLLLFFPPPPQMRWIYMYNFQIIVEIYIKRDFGQTERCQNQCFCACYQLTADCYLRPLPVSQPGNQWLGLDTLLLQPTCTLSSLSQPTAHSTHTSTENPGQTMCYTNIPLHWYTSMTTTCLRSISCLHASTLTHFCQK